MSHSCRAMLCETPHSDFAGHAMECGCAVCHEEQNHDWREWAVYPLCDSCVGDMMFWISENTDYLEMQREYGRAA